MWTPPPAFDSQRHTSYMHGSIDSLPPHFLYYRQYYISFFTTGSTTCFFALTLPRPILIQCVSARVNLGSVYTCVHSILVPNIVY